MAKGCFCHFNGYEVKDAVARRAIDDLKKTMNGNGNTVATDRPGALLQLKQETAGAAEIEVSKKFIANFDRDIVPGDKVLSADNYLYVFVEVLKGSTVLTDKYRCTLINDLNAVMQGNGETSGAAEASNAIPAYWTEELKAKAGKINEYLMAAGRKKSAFLCYADAHWTNNAQKSPKLLEYLYQNTGMNKVVFCGDIVDEETTMDYIWKWRAAVRGLPNHHSVPGNHDDGNTTNNLYTENQVYGFLIAPEETPDMTTGEGLYYYIDRPEEETRYLYLDTACYGVTVAQKAFIKNALLSTPTRWHIVAIAHRWYDANYNENPVTVGELNPDALAVLDMFDEYNAKTEDYKNCTGWVEFCVGGHTHMDYRGQSTGGIPVILVCTDSAHTRSGEAYEAGTIRESAVFGIIANYATARIDVVGIGRGGSSWVYYERGDDLFNGGSIGGEIVNPPLGGSYNNILKQTDIGYQADTELSTSSGTERASSGGYDLTGFIRVYPGDVIRLKNVIMPDGVTDRRNYIYLFDEDKKIMGNMCCTTTSTDGGEYMQPVFDENGNLVQFTNRDVATWAYIRINAQQIDDTSIITINEEIT